MSNSLRFKVFGIRMNLFLILFIKNVKNFYVFRGCTTLGETVATL